MRISYERYVVLVTVSFKNWYILFVWIIKRLFIIYSAKKYVRKNIPFIQNKYSIFLFIQHINVSLTTNWVYLRLYSKLNSSPFHENSLFSFQVNTYFGNNVQDKT